MPNQYHVGDLVRITGTFENAAGTDTDPAGTIIFKYKNPAGTITTYTYPTDAELVKDATGVYYVDISVDADGTWQYRAESGTGQGQSADEKAFFVIDSEFD